MPSGRDLRLCFRGGGLLCLGPWVGFTFWGPLPNSRTLKITCPGLPPVLAGGWSSSQLRPHCPNPEQVLTLCGQSLKIQEPGLEPSELVF